MSQFNLTVNTYPDSSFDLSSWAIRDANDEPERISVRKGNKEYSIVFSNPVRVEVWSVDKRGELGERLEILQGEIPDPIDEGFFGPQY